MSLQKKLLVVAGLVLGGALLWNKVEELRQGKVGVGWWWSMGNDFELTRDVGRRALCAGGTTPEARVPGAGA